MWRRLLIVTGLAALAAYFLRRRRPSRVSTPVDIDPAEELRRKLDEVRANEAAEAPVAEGTVEADLDARRRGVHDRARRAADEMQQSSSD
jgi:hypothetical protein